MAKKKTRRPATAGVTRGEFNALKADVAALANALDAVTADHSARMDVLSMNIAALKTETQTALANLTARIDSIAAPGELPADIVEKVTKLREDFDALKAEVGGGAFQLPRNDGEENH